MSLFHAIYGEGGVTPEPGGDTYGETQVLLWTNSTLNAKFTAQTVNLDLTDYDGVIIEFNQSTSTSVNLSGVSKIPKGSYQRYGTGYTVTGNETRARNVLKVDNSGVQFDGSTYGSAQSENGYCIPYRIYGYRQYKKETLTSAITDQKVANGNTDVNIGKGNYVLFSRADSDTSPVVMTKGTLIGYSYDNSDTGIYGKAYLAKADDDGIIRIPATLKYQIVTVG